MPLAKIYLTAYNALNALLWSAVLYRTATTLGVSAGRFDFDAVYPSVGTFTKWTQSLIVLDVIHVLLGLVRTSFLTTLLQAFSRVFLVWAIAPASPASHSSPFYALMISSWAVAEITRYSFHVAAATFPAGQVPKLLVWARYNFFFVLYLTGAGSEWVCMWKALPVMREWKDKDGGFGSIGSLSYWTVMVMLVAWPCFFPNQYLHMIALRRKMMRKTKARTA